MMYATVRRLAAATLFTASLAACGGGGSAGRTTPALQPQSANAPIGIGSAGASRTYTLPLVNGYSGTIGLRSKTGRGPSIIVDARVPATRRPQNSRIATTCPSIPLIRLANTSSDPLTVEITGFRITAPCNVNGQLFGVSAFQHEPQPQILSSTKLGDVAGVGNDIVFTPVVARIVLPANTTFAIAVLPESSVTSPVALPVAPGSTTVLTSNVSNVPTTLSFNYSSSDGGSLYSSACANAYTNGILDPIIAGSPLVGIPSFFCHFDPGNTDITFGSLVKFYIGAPKPDRSVLGFDGPVSTYQCGTATTSTKCETPSFTVSNTSPTAFQNVIVGNVADLRACAPATPNTDCAKLTSPAPGRTTVAQGSDFQVLVADDPTYRPGVGPWDGTFRAAISGPCEFRTLPDGGGVPPSPQPGQPGYIDATGVAFGPYAEYDVNALGAGACVITFGEDPKFITTDFRDPLHPLGRSVRLAVTIL